MDDGIENNFYLLKNKKNIYLGLKPFWMHIGIYGQI
jgi:hypothetical protein